MRREWLRFNALLRVFFIFLVLVLGTGNTLHAGSLQERHAAIEHALTFLHATASDDTNVAKYGADLLWCFYSISHASRDRELGESASRMGRELARRWRKSHQHVPPDATASEIYTLVAGAYAADLLGIQDPRLKTELRKAAAKYSARDYLGFDAPREPPTANDPDRYDTWSGALITTFFGDAYGIRLGASYRDVVQWLPRFRPFDGHDEDVEFDAFYAATHLIYTLNRYHERRVAPSLLPEELRFIRRKLDEAIAGDDPEMVGEALDCLKATGFENDPQVIKGMDYLVSSQLADGTWVEDEDDVYTAYHSAWTGIDGLRDYRFHGMVKKLPGNPPTGHPVH
jgi:hypothetical protein